jgi:hypothetical protein
VIKNKIIKIVKIVLELNNVKNPPEKGTTIQPNINPITAY